MRQCVICVQGIHATRMETDACAGRGWLREFGVLSGEESVLWLCDNSGMSDIQTGFALGIEARHNAKLTPC